MTTARRYGEDTPFGAWVRAQEDLDSRQHSLTVNDVDWIFHKYRTNVDAYGTRDLQLMMLVEVKTHGAVPNPQQQETLYMMHQLLSDKRKLKRRKGYSAVMVWHFGAFVLSLERDAPEDGTRMRWGIFNDDGYLQWISTTRVDSIKKVLGFTLEPKNPMSKLSFRRHHRTREIVQIKKTPLGFDIEKKVIFRS